MRTRRQKRHPHGVTIIELLVAISLIGVVLLATGNLLLSSWRSYDNLVWQNRVNQEARQVLDDVCDAVRMGGWQQDVLWLPSRSTTTGSVHYQVERISSESQIGSKTFQLSRFYIPAGTNSFVRYTNDFNNPIDQRVNGMFASQINFSYEYRLPASGDPNAATWQFQQRSESMNHASRFLVNVVYVTVTTQTTVNGQTYARTLSSAVQLRAPFNQTVPLAMTNGVRPPMPPP